MRRLARLQRRSGGADTTGGGVLIHYWLVTTELYPFAGGIGVYAHQAAASLAAAGVRTTVVFHDAAADRSTLERREGYRLIRFKDRDLAGDPLAAPDLHGHLAGAFAICEMLKALIAAEGAPDVVEIQDYGAAGYFFLKHRLMEMGEAAPRVVLTAHRPYVHCAASDEESLYDHRTVFLGDAERWCYAAADAVLAPSRYIVEALRRPGMDFPIREGDAHLVRNPFDPVTIARAGGGEAGLSAALALRRLQFTPDEPVLFFGKLQVQKGPWELLAALAALAGEGRPQPLWIWGRDAWCSPTSTTTYDFLERRHRRLFDAGLARMHGGYGPGDMAELCRTHPVCMVPYRAESLPYAFVEMALCGALPLVGPEGGQIELIPEALRPLLVVDFTRPDALGDRIDALKALGAADRAHLSGALAAEVARQTDPARVTAAKLAALERVRLRSVHGDYPFVHGHAKTFGALDPATRASLAEAIPQQGRTVSNVEWPGAEASRSGDDDLVSVVIPYFEMAEHIEATLQSVEAQSHDRVEIVIVDDGSPSPAAQARLAEITAAPRRFPIRRIRKYNGGLADARNAGARVARGGFLYFLDADDLLHPQTLAEGLAVLRRFPNVAYVGAWLREFEGGERAWLTWDIDSPYVAYRNLQICSFLIRAEAWMRHGVNDAALSLGMEDYESHLRLFAAGARGVALPRTRFHYRIRAGSMSRAFDPHIKAHLYRQIAVANPAVFDRYGALLAGMAAENGHGAMSPAPTEETPTHAALFARDIPTLHEIEETLEQSASRERLGRALRGRVHHGGAAWDYATARLLLALDREPAWAERMLAACAHDAPQNGWYRLYAAVAHLRAGRIGAASALWTADFARFRRQEAGAVDWVLGLESVRGFPHAPHAFRAFSGALAEEDGAAGDGEFAGADDCCDARFPPVRAALSRLRLSLDTPDVGAIRVAGAEALAQAERLVSPEAAAAMVRRWLGTWSDAARIDPAAPRRLAAAVAIDPTLVALAEPRPTHTRGFWDRSADAYGSAEIARRRGDPTLSPEEKADVELWSQVHACSPPGFGQSAMAANRATDRTPLNRLSRLMLEPLARKIARPSRRLVRAAQDDEGH